MSWVAIPATIAGIALSFLLLPLALSVRVRRDDEETPPDLELGLGAWLGAVGLTARQQVGAGAWHVGPRLFGRPLGVWATVGGDKAGTPEGDTEVRGDPDTAQSDDDDETAGPSLMDRVRRLASLLRPLLGPAWRMIRACPSAFSIRRVHASGRVGLSDPALTGQLQGVLHALRDALPKRLKIDVEADFVAPGMRGEVAVLLHFHLGKLLFFVIRFALMAGTGWLLSRLSLWRLDRARSASPGTAGGSV